ncbi:hypothetical protein BB561_001920 [Smittium simulii]|uniref:Elongator complex protein 5 n=1 Tax=Smittium simulii TaxID=133385 RepID=A0A2T9YSE5_9FUNG|nr:hypothetical protein BB561_001920 [Smittium simulii]
MEPTISTVLSNKFNKANFILIQDSLQNNGVSFLNNFISQEFSLGKTPIIVSTAHSPQLLCSYQLPSSNCIDLRSKVSLKECGSIHLSDFFLDFALLFSKIKAILATEKAESIVVIDSLERFLLQSVPETIDLLERLKNIIKDKNRLVILHHFEPAEYNYKSLDTTKKNPQNHKSKSFANKSMIESMMNVVLTLYSTRHLKLWMMPGWFDDEQQAKAQIIPKSVDIISKSPTSALYNSAANGLIFMEHKKPAGKIKREICEYFFTNNLISYKFPIISTDKAPPQEMVELGNDISFNLNLTDKQKEDKDNVYLPYLDAQT